MAITNAFKEAVQNGKKSRVYCVLKDSLLFDPTGANFDEKMRYATEKMGDLYEKHDGEALNYDPSSWNETYLDDQMVKVVDNFSKERVKLLKEMVAFLYKDKAEQIRNEAKKQTKITKKQAGTGVTVAGAALAVAGVCTSHAILTVGGVAAAVVGIAVLVSDKEGK